MLCGIHLSTRMSLPWLLNGIQTENHWADSKSSWTVNTARPSHNLFIDQCRNRCKMNPGDLNVSVLVSQGCNWRSLITRFSFAASCECWCYHLSTPCISNVDEDIIYTYIHLWLQLVCFFISLKRTSDDQQLQALAPSTLHSIYYLI